MRAKLIRYPYQKKKYRWDRYKMGKEFQYTWYKSILKDWDKILPYYTYTQINSLNRNQVLGTVDMDNLGASYTEDIDYVFRGMAKDANNKTSNLVQKDIPDSVPRRVVTEYSDAELWFSQPGTYTYNNETFDVIDTPKIYYKVTESTAHSYVHGIVLTENGGKTSASPLTYTTFYTPKVGNSSGSMGTPTTTDYIDGSEITNDIYGSWNCGSLDNYQDLFALRHLTVANTSWKRTYNPISGGIIHWVGNDEIYATDAGKQEVKDGLWPGESYTALDGYATDYIDSDIDGHRRANMGGFVYHFPHLHSTSNAKLGEHIPSDWVSVISLNPQICTMAQFDKYLTTTVANCDYNQNRTSHGATVDTGYKTRAELAAHMTDMPTYRVDISTQPLEGYTEFTDETPTIYTLEDLQKAMLKTVYETDTKVNLILAQPENDKDHVINSSCFGTYNWSTSALPVTLQKIIYSSLNLLVGNLNSTGVSTYYINTQNYNIRGDEQLVSLDTSVYNKFYENYNITGRLYNYLKDYSPTNDRIYLEYFGNHHMFEYWTHATAATDISIDDFQLDLFAAEWIDAPWINLQYRDIRYTVLAQDIKAYSTNQTTYWINQTNASISDPGWKKVRTELIDNTNYNMTNPAVVRISDWPQWIQNVNQFKYYGENIGFYRNPQIVFIGWKNGSITYSNYSQYEDKWKLENFYTLYHIGYSNEGTFVEKELINKAIATWERVTLRTDTDLGNYCFKKSDFNWPPGPGDDHPVTALPQDSRTRYFLRETFAEGAGDYFTVDAWVAHSFNPLSFNEYTPEDWQSDYHYTSDNWNASYSPFGYTNDNTKPMEDREDLTLTRTNETGTLFIDRKSVFEINNKVLSVTDNNHHSAFIGDYTGQENMFNSYIGSLWFAGADTVTSTNKSEYPDGGSVGGYFYLMKKEATKFLRYNKSTDMMASTILDENRYAYTHSDQYNPDTSRYNTVIGTTSSTNESSIPDGYWTQYKGVYLGDSIPSLGIVENAILPEDILGVPNYEKQINTSDTLKYGTVASASLMFTLNKPIDEAMAYNKALLVLLYDFEHSGAWINFGFFYIDSVEALDEYTSRLTGHDEVYKLNKYVDDFLSSQTTSTNLKNFYYDLLDYCDCCYDPHKPNILNWNFPLDNVYDATKTTGLEVAHYVANISPGFVHANVEGDVVLEQYRPNSNILTNEDYTQLTYNAYKSATVNKVKIVNNNIILGEDSGTGENIYYIKDNPLIALNTSSSYINLLVLGIINQYTQLAQYRPAKLNFLILPNLKIGDMVNIVSQTNQMYKIAVMRMTINEAGIEIESYGTATYPVEADSENQFTNIINNIDNINTEITDIGDNITDINAAIHTLNENDQALDSAVDSIGSRLTDAETAISLNTNFRNNYTNNNTVTTANNLSTVKLNGHDYSNFAMKGYADGVLTSAKSYSDSKLTEAKNYTDSSLTNTMVYEVKQAWLWNVQGGSPSGINTDMLIIHNLADTYGLMYTLDSNHLVFTKHISGGNEWWYGDKYVVITWRE